MTAPAETEEQTTATQSENSEPRYAHFVDKSKIVDNMVQGTAMYALCGFRFIPGRNPAKYPTCPECKSVLDSLREFMESTW